MSKPEIQSAEAEDRNSLRQERKFYAMVFTFIGISAVVMYLIWASGKSPANPEATPTPSSPIDAATRTVTLTR